MTAGYKTLSSLGARLGAEARSERALDAVIDGVPVEVRYVLRDHGSSASKWTEIGVRSEQLAGLAFTFKLDVRPTERHDAEDVRDGRTRDIVLGDSAFDDAFVVEAAPEEVMRLMFDATARAEMLALRPLRVITTPTHAIMIERLDWIEDVDALEGLTRLAVRLAASLMPSAREAALARRRSAEARGYRERAPTDEEIRAQWDVDVDRVAGQIERRRARTQKNALLLTAFILVAVIGLIALVASR